MKKILFTIVLVTGIAVVSGCSNSTETVAPAAMSSMDHADMVMPHTVADAEVGQEALCPVMGNKVVVNKGTLSVEYKGKVYYFCCADCPDKFKADPEKYIQK